MIQRVKVVLKIPDSLVARMKDVVEAGGYDDPQEFVRTAISNQVELEEDRADEPKSIEEALEAVDTDGGPTSETRQAGTTEEPDATSEGDNRDSPLNTEDGGTEVSLSRREYDELPTVAPPAEDRLDDGPLWGQYNRIFPVKLVVRGLANELAQRPQDADVGVELPTFHRRIGIAARSVGLKVAEADERAGRKRGETLAAGLPTGDDATKSLDRFQTHFVGRIERSDELTGAPPHLSFVDLVGGNPDRISLTEAGREFAALPNSLLDDGVDADRSLSETERQFYLTHAENEREAEYAAMQKVAQAITEGDNRPDSLTERIAYLDPSWSKSQAQTIRSGLTSRMYELGLLDRRRVGQRGIAYELTTAGGAFHAGGDTATTEH